MNLLRMTEAYRTGGREALVAAVEEFSVTVKAEMMSALKGGNPGHIDANSRYLRGTKDRTS